MPVNTSSPSKEEIQDRKQLRRLALLLLLLGLGLVLLWLGLVTYQLFQVRNSLLEHQQNLNQIRGEGLMEADPSELERLAVGVREDINTIQTIVSPFEPLAPILAPLPKVGPISEAAPELLSIADSGSEAALLLVQAFSPALKIIQSGDGFDQAELPKILESLQVAEPELIKASAALALLENQRSNLKNEEDLPIQAQDLLKLLDDNLPLARESLSVTQILPELMGMNGRRSYLILAQNEDELRATGGFISGAGLLTVENGQIQVLDFENANLIDDWQNKPYDFPPQPFNDFMGMDIFLFRDSNFWPDFPTSAEMAMDLYTYGQNVSLDGVVALDQRFLQGLLKATGPLYVSDLDQTVNSMNVVQEMRKEWGPGNQLDQEENWILDRKSFMGPLSRAIKDRILLEFDSVDLFQLARSIQEGIEQRHLQVYVRDRAAAQIFTKVGWDGGLVIPNAGDFLLAVDTNMGFNKVNAAVERSLKYRVILDDQGEGSAELSMEYGFPENIGEKDCAHGGNRYNKIKGYGDLIEDCYWNYLRIYTPIGSKLRSSSEHPLSGDFLLSGKDWDGESRKVSEPGESAVIFANFILLSPGEKQTSTLEYELPAVVNTLPDGSARYSLLVRKQAGIRDDSIEVIIVLPDSAEFISSDPEPSTIRGQEITYQGNLTTDLTVDVHYR